MNQAVDDEVAHMNFYSVELIKVIDVDLMRNTTLNYETLLCDRRVVSLTVLMGY
ncbi:hypothetical protein JXB12_04030 [candidate division KSB1 bacterium]|nr:hypothetical protein [candidate division KSB1 bacterium]